MGKKFRPESQLTKHGWTEGAGLGRSEDGIKEALKVKLKFDQAGVGHDQSEQFTYHWWDHVFNKAANSISVDSSQNGVSVRTNGDCQITNKKGKVAATDRKALLYGSFIKASTLTDGVEAKEDSCDSSDSDSEEDQDLGTASKLTDEQLMKICGGRTAHKAARHGLGLSGKLARIAQQEQSFVTTVPEMTGIRENDTVGSGTGSESGHASGEVKQKRGKSKRKGASDENIVDVKAEKKRKRKREVEIESDAMEADGVKTKRKKRKHAKLGIAAVGGSEDCDTVIESEILTEISESLISCDTDLKGKKKNKKKKKKSKDS